MTRRQDDLLSKALMLPVPERAQLAHQILESLKDEDFDDNIRQAWQAEIARRLAEVRDGTAETCSWEEIEAELLEAEAQHGR